MKQTRKVIHIVKHMPTGAKVPVIVRKVNKDNIITDYAEYTEKRKGFTVSMLQNRWDKCFEDVLELLQKYEVPAYVTHAELKDLSPGQLPVTKAIFFEEYVYGIERKAALSHKKLKPKHLTEFVEH